MWFRVKGIGQRTVLVAAFEAKDETQCCHYNILVSCT